MTGSACCVHSIRSCKYCSNTSSHITNVWRGVDRKRRVAFIYWPEDTVAFWSYRGSPTLSVIPAQKADGEAPLEAILQPAMSDQQVYDSLWKECGTWSVEYAREPAPGIHLAQGQERESGWRWLRGDTFQKAVKTCSLQGRWGRGPWDFWNASWTGKAEFIAWKKEQRKTVHHQELIQMVSKCML